MGRQQAHRLALAARQTPDRIAEKQEWQKILDLEMRAAEASPSAKLTLRAPVFSVARCFSWRCHDLQPSINLGSTACDARYAPIGVVPRSR